MSEPVGAVGRGLAKRFGAVVVGYGYRWRWVVGERDRAAALQLPPTDWQCGSPTNATDFVRKSGQACLRQPTEDLPRPWAFASTPGCPRVTGCIIPHAGTGTPLVQGAQFKAEEVGRCDGEIASPFPSSAPSPSVSLFLALCLFGFLCRSLCLALPQSPPLLCNSYCCPYASPLPLPLPLPVPSPSKLQQGTTENAGPKWKCSLDKPQLVCRPRQMHAKTRTSKQRGTSAAGEAGDTSADGIGARPRKQFNASSGTSNLTPNSYVPPKKVPPGNVAWTGRSLGSTVTRSEAATQKAWLERGVGGQSHSKCLSCSEMGRFVPGPREPKACLATWPANGWSVEEYFHGPHGEARGNGWISPLPAQPLYKKHATIRGPLSSSHSSRVAPSCAKQIRQLLPPTANRWRFTNTITGSATLVSP